MRTLPAPPDVAVLQPLTLPAASVARNWTRVSPSDVTFTVAPVIGEVKAPPLKDVRCWTVATPDAASAALAATLTDAAAVQAPVAPEGVTVGATRSMRTVAAAVPAAGAHAEALPAASYARNCTSVSPSVLTDTLVPACGGLHVAPPSVLVRDSYESMPERPSDAPVTETVRGTLVPQAVEPPYAPGDAPANGWPDVRAACVPHFHARYPSMSWRSATVGTRSKRTTSPRSPARRKPAVGFTAMPSTAHTAPPVDAADPAAPLR